MRSIGIFGDSFTGITNSPGYKTHWSSLLADHYDCNLTNYGFPGSSVYYSYKKFKENFNKHNLNIFLVTEPGRYFKSVEFKKDSGFVPNIVSLVNDWDNIVDPSPENIKGWFLSTDDTYHSDICSAMIENLIKDSRSQDLVIIPCFSNSLSESLSSKLGLSPNANLCDFQAFQSYHFNIHPTELVRNYTENHDYISGHLIPEINYYVFQMILEKITTGNWNWKLPSNFVSKYEFKELWRKI